MSGESIDRGGLAAPKGVEGGGLEDMGHYGERPTGPLATRIPGKPEFVSRQY